MRYVTQARPASANGPTTSSASSKSRASWTLAAEETSYKYADHRQVIKDLKSETDYELRVIATNKGGKTVSPIVRFTTLVPPPPVIKDITVKPEETRAIVTFSLDAKGPAKTEYHAVGTSFWLAGPNETSSDYRDHRHVIKGLRPESDHQLRVIATNPSGTTVSDIVPFKTKVRTVECDEDESIQVAIDRAKSGDTLRIKGTCLESVTINKDLVLKGHSDDSRVAGGAVIGNPWTQVTIANLRMVQYGCITNRGDLTITDSIVGGCYGNYGGDPAVIVNAVGASVRIERSTISGRYVVTNRGTFTAIESKISGGGLYVHQPIHNLAGGSMTLRDSTVGASANSDPFVNDGTTTLERTTVSAGGPAKATINNGTMTVRESTFSESTALYDNGGAINNTGSLTVVDSVFRDNEAGRRGGAIYNSGDLSVVDTAFRRNTAGDPGGAIYNTGSISLSGATFTGNTPNDCVNAEGGTGC